MKAITIFILVLHIIYAQDIEEVRQHKLAYKKAKHLQKIDSTEKSSIRMMIIFKHNKNNISTLQLKYSIKLEKCIASRACIFRVSAATVDMKELRKKIREENDNIESVQGYRKYHFNRL